MANGFTTFTNIAAKGLPSAPGLVKLETAAGVAYYLWVDSTGDLRIGTAIPTAPDSDGSVVGGQS